MEGLERDGRRPGAGCRRGNKPFAAVSKEDEHNVEGWADKTTTPPRGSSWELRRQKSETISLKTD